VKVQKWGESLAVRLPSTVVRDMRLTPGQSIEVSCRGGIITMKAVPKKEPSLRERLKVFDRVKHAGEAMTGRMR
jgi:antitoxin MazE